MAALFFLEQLPVFLQDAVDVDVGVTWRRNASTVEPAAYFGTGTMDLVWRDGRWEVASTQGAFGPTPRTRTPREGAEGFELQDLAKDFRPYGVAP